MDLKMGPRRTLRDLILRPPCGPKFETEIWTQFGVHGLAANTCVTFRCQLVSASKMTPIWGPGNQTGIQQLECARQFTQSNTHTLAHHSQLLTGGPPLFHWGLDKGGCAR